MSSRLRETRHPDLLALDARYTERNQTELSRRALSRGMLHVRDDHFTNELHGRSHQRVLSLATVRSRHRAFPHRASL